MLLDFQFQPGEPPYLQLAFAVKKAVVAGRLQPGKPFPSVRALSQELRLNPNTVHKAVALLTREGILEVRPGIGTVIARINRPVSPAAQAELLGPALERFVVEAKRLALTPGEVVDALKTHWKKL